MNRYDVFFFSKFCCYEKEKKWMEEEKRFLKKILVNSCSASSSGVHLVDGVPPATSTGAGGS